MIARKISDADNTMSVIVLGGHSFFFVFSIFPFLCLFCAFLYDTSKFSELQPGRNTPFLRMISFSFFDPKKTPELHRCV